MLCPYQQSATNDREACCSMILKADHKSNNAISQTDDGNRSKPYNKCDNTISQLDEYNRKKERM